MTKFVEGKKGSQIKMKWHNLRSYFKLTKEPKAKTENSNGSLTVSNMENNPNSQTYTTVSSNIETNTNNKTNNDSSTLSNLENNPNSQTYTIETNTNNKTNNDSSTLSSNLENNLNSQTYTTVSSNIETNTNKKTLSNLENNLNNQYTFENTYKRPKRSLKPTKTTQNKKIDQQQPQQIYNQYPPQQIYNQRPKRPSNLKISQSQTTVEKK